MEFINKHFAIPLGVLISSLSWQANLAPAAMAPYMSVDRAYQSYGPVNKEALSRQLSRSERGLLRLGLVKPEQWRQQPTEALYQVVISEVLDDGQTQHLERGGGRAFAVAAVLDLGLRMLESPRGRDGKQRPAREEALFLNPLTPLLA